MTATDSDTAEIAPQVSATELHLTPLEASLHEQWYDESYRKDVPEGGEKQPWEVRQSRARARLKAFSEGVVAEVPSDFDEWIADLPAEWMLRFVLALRTFGVVAIACSKARVSQRTVNRYQSSCPAFATACQEAVTAVDQSIEGAQVVSATTGDPEPIFDKGEHCGWKRRKSEKAAENQLKARIPHKYRSESAAVQITNVALPSADAVMDALKRLNQAPPSIEDVKPEG